MAHAFHPDFSLLFKSNISLPVYFDFALALPKSRLKLPVYYLEEDKIIQYEVYLLTPFL
jgi:hypothetical protein